MVANTAMDTDKIKIYGARVKVDSRRWRGHRAGLLPVHKSKCRGVSKRTRDTRSSSRTRLMDTDKIKISPPRRFA